MLKIDGDISVNFSDAKLYIVKHSKNKTTICLLDDLQYPQKTVTICLSKTETKKLKETLNKIK